MHLRKTINQRRGLSFMLVAVSCGLIFLYGCLGNWLSAHIPRTFRIPNALLALNLLPFLAGFLLAWAVQGIPLRRLHFDLANFLMYTLLPLCLACIAVLLLGWMLAGARVPSSVTPVWVNLFKLRSLWTLVAGWGLGFSFRSNAQQ